MTLRVEICRMSDLIVRVHEMDLDWDDGDVEGSCEYLWSEGNFGCDCNRALFFARAVDEDPDDDETPCGSTAFRIRITENGRVVYRDDDYPETTR